MKSPIPSPSLFNPVQVIFLVFVVLLPFVYSPGGVDPVLLPRQTLVGLLILVVAGYLLVKLKTNTGIASVVPLLVVTLVLVYGLSVFRAVNQTEAWYITVKIAVFASFFLLAYIGFKEQYLTLRLVSAAVTLSAVAAVGFVVRDIVFLHSRGLDVLNGENLYKVNATFGHKNLVSSFLFLCLPLMGVQLVYATKSVWRMLIAFAVLLVLATVILLQTRTVLLAMLVCMGVAVVLLLQNRLVSRKQRRIGMSVFFVLLCLLVSAGYLFREKLTYLTRTESFIERKHVWENTWQMIGDNPLGVGAANWQIHFPKYGMQKFYEVNYTITEGLTNFQRPHNDFLWVWAETGFAGFMVYVLIFLVSCWSAYRLYRREQHAKAQLAYGLVLIQLIGFIVVSLADFPLERIEHPVLILTSIAFISSVSGSARINIHLSRWVLLLMAGVAAYGIFICSKRWQSEVQLKKMYKAHNAGDWVKLVSDGKKAQTRYLNMDYYSIPVCWYIGVGYFMQQNLPLAKQYFEEAYKLHPYQVHVLNNYGACYEKEGDHTKAIELLEAANSISPSFSDGIINLSGAYFNAGRYDEAFHKITTIGYDDHNPRLKTFVVAIVKKKVELMLAETPEPANATFLRFLLSNDEAILKHFRASKESHFVLLDLLEGKQTP